MSARNWRNNERLLAELRTAPSTTGIYVRKDGTLARVNVGDGAISVPVRGRYRPFRGDPVLLEWHEGRIYMAGPAVAKTVVGTVTATGNPLLTVTAGARTYKLPFAVSYDNAAVGDTVGIEWADEDSYITGKISGSAELGSVEEKISLDQHPFTLYFFAKQSGSYSSYDPPGAAPSTSSWRTQAIEANADALAAWYYGNALRKSLRNDAYISSVEIYMPLVWDRDRAHFPRVGRHTEDVKPSGSPSITDEDETPDLDSRNGSKKFGWIHLPTAWADLWRSNSGGVGIAHGGDALYDGLPNDRQSGKLRIRGRQ